MPWRRTLLMLCDLIDDVVRRLATAAAYLIVLVAAVQIGVSILRTFYSYAPLMPQELIPNLNVVLVSVSICYGVLRDVHTRVDILSEQLGEASRARVELVLVLTLFWPSALFLAVAVAAYVTQSWATLESSRNVGGLGGVYVVKSFLLVMAVLLVAQGLAIVVRILTMPGSPYVGAAHEHVEP